MYKRFFATRSAYIMQQHVCTTCCMYGYNYTPLPPFQYPQNPTAPRTGAKHTPHISCTSAYGTCGRYYLSENPRQARGYLSAYHARQQYYTYARRSGHVPTNYRRFTYYKPKPYADMKGRANR